MGTFPLRKWQCLGHTPLSHTLSHHWHITILSISPSLPSCFQRLLGSGSCDPPWASSTLTNDDNILNWSGSPISGTQTQISGSSPVKRAPGTVPWLPNLNQQRSRENDRAWTAAALPCLYHCQAAASLTSSFFISFSFNLCLSHSSTYLSLHLFSDIIDVMKNNIGETVSNLIYLNRCLESFQQYRALVLAHRKVIFCN